MSVNVWVFGGGFLIKGKSGPGMPSAQQETLQQDNENRPPPRRRQGNCITCRLVKERKYEKGLLMLKLFLFVWF